LKGAGESSDAVSDFAPGSHATFEEGCDAVVVKKLCAMQTKRRAH
jgi:hypothetical protein